MGWHLLETLLQQVGEHSTLVGKLWVTATFVFRFIVVASVGDAVYSDEQSDFTCNTAQPGCENVCFNLFSPISHLRFWAAQIIAVCTPSIVFVVFSAHMLLKIPQEESQDFPEDGDLPPLDDELIPPPVSQPSSPRKGKGGKGGSSFRSQKPPPKAQPVVGMVRGFANPPDEATDAVEDIREGGAEEDEENDGNETEDVFDDDKNLEDINRELALLDKLGPPPQSVAEKKEKRIKKEIQTVYVIALLLKTGFEAVFLWLQFALYGFVVPERFQCMRSPCPNLVDCYVSRPKEKTIFLWFMFIVSAICLALNLVEIKYLGIKRLKKVLCRGVLDDGDGEKSDKLDDEKCPSIDMDSKASKGSYFRVNGKVDPTAPPATDEGDLYNVISCSDKETKDDSIGFGAIGSPPSYPIPGYPYVHRYGMILNATPPPRRSDTPHEPQESYL
ncbi:gap junction delta-2 protein-like [Styela clava]